MTRGAKVRDTYRQAVEGIGGALVEIEPGSERARLAETAPREALAGLQGLLLTGGGDIDPLLYRSSTRHPSIVIEPERDRVELALTRAALAAGLPVLGICRGIQCLNVAMGGSLWQDLPSERPSPVIHREPGEDRDRRRLVHTVEVAPDTVLARAIGPGTLRVNSLHHQAIRDLGRDLRAVAIAPDGVVEAVEVPGCAFAVAVQWHPEDLWDREARHAALFATFSAAAESRTP